MDNAGFFFSAGLAREGTGARDLANHRQIYNTKYT